MVMWCTQSHHPSGSWKHWIPAKGTLIWKLQTSLDGLRSAPTHWQDHLEQILRKCSGVWKRRRQEELWLACEGTGVHTGGRAQNCVICVESPLFSASSGVHNIFHLVFGFASTVFTEHMFTIFGNIV